MTKIRLTITLLAVLTALMLAGCGRTDDSTVDSSSPEGIQTFGVEIDPSAQPSMGQVMPEILDVPEGSVSQDASGTVTTQDTQTESDDPTEPPQDEPEETTPSKKPSDSTSTAKPSTDPSPSPSTSPTIVPPAPMSSATISDVEAYVGRPLSELIENLGYPSGSDYEPIDEENPDQGEFGTLYFATCTVSTRRDADGEIVISVTPISVAEESPAPSEEPAESPAPSE